MGGKNSKNIALILGALFLLMIIIYYFSFLNSAENSTDGFLDGNCESISDSQNKAECYTELARTTGEVGYCTNTNYWFEECLEIADPNFEADIDVLNEVCESVTDSSKRNECYEYVEENY